MKVTSNGSEVLRSVLRRVPSPVAVVTAGGPGGARGITVGSFTSVSLAPPLVSFNVERRAQMHEVLQAASHFAVHLLGDRHAHLGGHFARPNRTGAEQLEGVPHRYDRYGNPILDEALAVITCRRFAAYDAGDHSIFVGEVLGIDERAGGAGLLYYDRTFRSVGEAVG